MAGITKVLGIAISEYEDASIKNLDNCLNDITQIINQLADRYVFEEIELVYAKGETTRKEIHTKFRHYFLNALEGDSLLLIYAGHGQFEDITNSTYWQPSDADASDSSSWVSLNEILKYVKASKASHIGIISDSCFSGGIFESPYRGGGVEKIKGRKSREALTSGGKEKVSDGKGENSPFTLTLIKILSQNVEREITFHDLSIKLILEFEKNSKQSPQYGILEGMQDEGGVFIFQLKDALIPPEKIDHLEVILKELYIPLTEAHKEDIQALKKIVSNKIELVKSQQYEKASLLRQEELKIHERISKEFKLYLKALIIQKVEDKKSMILNMEIERYNKEIEDEMEKYIEEMPKRESKQAKEGRVYISSRLFGEKDEPAIKLFRGEKENLFSQFKKSPIELYKYFKLVRGNIKASFFDLKEDSLISELVAIYLFQIQLLTSSFYGDIKKEKIVRELGLDILRWIDND